MAIKERLKNNFGIWTDMADTDVAERIEASRELV